MIPLKQYLEAKRHYDQNAIVAILPSLFGLLCGLAALASITAPYKPSSCQPVPPIPLGIGLGLFALLSLVGLSATLWLSGRFRQCSEVSCPHCKKAYRDQFGVVVATGKCPSCLKHVIDLHQDEKELSRPLLTLDRLKRVSKYRRRWLIASMLWWPFVTLAGTLFAFALVHLWPERVGSGEKPLDDIKGSTVFAGLMLSGPFIAAACYAWRTFVRCPACQAFIHYLATVIASGNCPHCGRTIVKDATPHTEYRPLPKLAKVEEASKHYSRRMAIRLLGGIAISYGVMLLGVSVKDYLATDVGGFSSEVLSGTLLVLVVVVLSTVCFATLGQYRRYTELMCGSCGQAIVDQRSIVRCTGNCPHCGQRVIKDA